MARKLLILFLLTLATAQSYPTQDTDIITEPKPGQEYVFVQTSASNARPIARKEKATQDESRPFETAHKVPLSLTYALGEDDDEIEVSYGKEEVKEIKGKKVLKRNAPAPAPPGATKIDVKALLAKYQISTSTTKTPPTTMKAVTTTRKNSRKRGNKRVKKDAIPESLQATSPSPSLTTARFIPKSIESDDIPLLGAASEKQRSRIQIKKGPNGQEYEYEYVYYYYDDEDEPKNKVTNSHDGPARNQIPSRGDLSREKPIPEANEILPVRGNKNRGRQLGEDETINDERLPAVTRFPPRSRNLNATPLPEEDSPSTRGRGRGRPTTEAASSLNDADNVSDETQGSRGRTRANIRRPSLDLVDSDSFNNHGNSQGKPSFPQELPEGPEVQEEPAAAVYRPKEELPPSPPAVENEKVDTTIASTEDSTTAMSPMDKVALDLYAISQGTQKLYGEGGEDGEISTEGDNTAATDQTELTTDELSTEPETSTTTTSTTTMTTTTTTTTTTTPPPPPSTEAPSHFGRGKFGAGRRGKKTTAHTTTTEAAPTEKKSKFGRPSFGGRSRSRTTAAPAVDEEVHKEEAKPVSHSKPSRSRFGGSRTRGRTTAAPEESREESSPTPAPSHKPSLPRSRPSFNVRSRGRTTAAPSTEHEDTNESSGSTAEASTTARSRRINAGAGIRPLRPGARINLSGRGRGATTSTTTEAPAEDHVTGDEEPEAHDEEEAGEKEETPSPVDNSPLGRLRNKNRINIQARPKAAASAPVHVRRVNPLLGRRRPGHTTEAPSSEAPQDSSSTEEAETPEADDETEPAAQSSSTTTTTEEPKGLNKLLAGRRRLGARTPGTLVSRA